jgi:ketosteroid isomerase-like protein
MKKKLGINGLFLAILLLVVACTTEEKQVPMDMESVKAEIQAIEDGYAAGEKAKDAKAVASYYSENAISYSRNQQPVSGRSAIEAMIAKRIKNDTTGTYNVYKVVDLFAEGNTAVEVGSWTEYDTSGTELEKGYYMSYFQKNAEGTYECVRDMSVTTKPEMPGMPSM